MKYLIIWFHDDGPHGINAIRGFKTKTQAMKIAQESWDEDREPLMVWSLREGPIASSRDGDFD